MESVMAEAAVEYPGAFQNPLRRSCHQRWDSAHWVVGARCRAGACFSAAAPEP